MKQTVVYLYNVGLCYMCNQKYNMVELNKTQVLLTKDHIVPIATPDVLHPEQPKSNC